MRERLSTTDSLRPTLDRKAAIQATVVALSIALAIAALQGAVSAALTTGTQPVAQVDSVPMEPDAEAWSDAPARTVSLQKQQMAIPFGGGSVDEMDVQTVTNDSHVAFKLSWADPTNDTAIGAPNEYSDAAAVMLHSGETPPIAMGAMGEPVNIWYWRSSWEFGEKGAPWSGDMYAYPHPHNETQPGQAAGNPLSRDAYDQFAQNYYAKGYGSLSHAPNQPVTADAQRTENGWEVTFVRERGANGTYDAQFSDEKPMYLAFAVWNGSEREVNGQKSLTMTFTELDLQENTLGPAEDDSGGESSSGGSATTATGGDGGSSLPTDLSGWVVMLVLGTAFAWMVAYRRAR